jgi:hypothetical protein
MLTRGSFRRQIIFHIVDSYLPLSINTVRFRVPLNHQEDPRPSLLLAAPQARLFQTRIELLCLSTL